MTEREAGPQSISVLYEDRWLVALDKPAGMLVHGDGTGAATLADLARAHLLDIAACLDTQGEPDAAAAQRSVAAQLQPVQRLDVDTTGIVLFSKDKATQPKLDALVASHDGIRKRYLAMVRGRWPWDERLVDAPVARDRHDARRMRVAPNGKPSRSRVALLARTGSRAACASLLLVELETGRKHQIRVHLSSLGFPIPGDVLYGNPTDRRRVTPLMLHAWAEDLTHPVTGGPLALRAPMPVRFTERFPNVEDLLAHR